MTEKPEDITPPSPFDFDDLMPPAEEDVSAKQQIVIEDEFAVPVALKFAFIGCGQAGSKLANQFYKLGYRRVGVVNTTTQDSAGLEPALQERLLDLRIGGASKDPAVAAKELKRREEDLWDLLHEIGCDGVDYLIICAGLGGGTGTGLSPEVARVAQEFMTRKGLPKRVGALVTLPMSYEGQRVCRNAVEGFETLYRQALSPLIVIDNEQISNLFKKPGIGKLYDPANTRTTGMLHLFNKLAAYRSDIATFDVSEFRDILDQGITVMGSSEISNISSPADITHAIQEQLSGNLLAAVDLTTGSRAACLFAGSDLIDSLSFEYYAAGFDKLERMLKGANKVVHRGIYRAKNPNLQCYVMLSGLRPPQERLKQLAIRGNVNWASASEAAELNVD